MASITTATSGLASATSTWTGAVVPGTTFAGTRTTGSAGYAVGATTIALSAASPAVTAGKWLKFAGHTTMHRVATGLGTGAGNIVLDAPGLLESIPAAPTNVSVDMTGDKVTIAHPGTNNASSTAYLLNGAHSAGVTTINVNTGSGTIVAGECVQFEHQLGTDADGRPYYDNTYYKVQTTLTAGVIVLTSGTAYAMASGVRVVNRGHVVEQNIPFAVWGDDTSNTTTVGSNGIALSGTVKASRSTSNKLVLRGTMYGATGATLDYGWADTDAIPAAVTALLTANDSATLAVGKHVIAIGATIASGVTLKAAGAPRTRNTTLPSGCSASAGSITVAAADNWANGDKLVVASDTDDPARSQVTFITGGSGLTWSVSPSITNARAADTRVGNLTSNVRVGSYSAANPTCLSFAAVSTDALSVSRVSDTEFVDMGSISGWALSNSVAYYGAVSMRGPSLPTQINRSCAFHQTGSLASGHCAMAFDSFVANRTQCINAAVYASTTRGAFYFGGASRPILTDSVVYAATAPFFSGFGGGSPQTSIGGGASWGVSNTIDTRELGSTYLSDHSAFSLGTMIVNGSGFVQFDNCQISSPAARFMGAVSVGAPGRVQANGCTFGGAALTTALTAGSAPAQASVAQLVAVNGTASDNRVRSYYQETVTDLTTRLHGTYAVKIQPLVANTAITYTFTLPAVSGVAQVIKGSLRFDAAYGTANPPSIALSGQGVTQSFTCTATAGAWFDFSFSFTPTSTGDITATVTVQSASTSGFAWLDGVYHYPMIQAVRHFGYLWKPQAAQEADPSITVSEATALAYPVAVNHGTTTITVSADATARQVYEACMADLCATANNAVAQHISTTDAGASFTTTYTVALSGGAVITGNYTDATGVHVVAAATLPITGCRVQLYDVTNTVELDNQVVTGTSYLFPLTYTGARTLRLRVAYQSGATAKLPQEVLAALTAVGATFTVPDETDAVYVANAIDGSTCTEFTANYPDLHIDTSDGDGTTSWQRIYAWARFTGMAEDGIRLMHNAVQAQDIENYLIDVAAVDAHIDNTTGTPLLIVGAYGRRSDGTTVIAATSGSIQMDPGRAYIASTAGVATDVWAAATRTLTAGTNIVLAKGTGVTGFNDLSAAQVNAEADAALSDAGVTTTVTGRIDAAVSTRLASAGYTAPDNASITAIKAKTDNLPAAPAAVSDIPTVTAVWAAASRTLTAGTNIVLAKGTGVTGFNDISTAQVNAEVASALSGSSLATDVWAAATRTLTAGTNIVLAKGTGVTGFTDLSAAQVNAEVDTALADAGVSSVLTARVDANVQDLAKIHGLVTGSPLAVSTTQRTAGGIVQTIAEAAGTTTVTRTA